MHLLELGDLEALEGLALLEEDLRQGDDQAHPLLDLGPAEAGGLAAREPQGQASRLLPGERPEDDGEVDVIEDEDDNLHGGDEEHGLEGSVGSHVELLHVAEQGPGTLLSQPHSSQ